jgi:hypothetical protein
MGGSGSKEVVLPVNAAPEPSPAAAEAARARAAALEKQREDAESAYREACVRVVTNPT